MPIATHIKQNKEWSKTIPASLTCSVQNYSKSNSTIEKLDISTDSSIPLTVITSSVSIISNSAIGASYTFFIENHSFLQVIINHIMIIP